MSTRGQKRSLESKEDEKEEEQKEEGTENKDRKKQRKEKDTVVKNLSNYKCKDVRHEFYDALTPLFTRDNKCESGIVNLISEYYYVASEKIFTDLANRFISPSQNPEGAQDLELDSFKSISSVFSSVLFKFKELNMITVPPDMQARYEISKARVKKINADRKIIHDKRQLKLEQRRILHIDRWGHTEAFHRQLTRRQERQKRIQKKKKSKTKADIIDDAEKRLEEKKQISEDNGADTVADEDSTDDDYEPLSADDSEIKPHLLKNILSDEPLENCTLGQFLSDLVSRYYHGYHLIRSLIAEKKNVRKYFSKKENKQELKDMMHPDEFLQEIMQLFDETYSNGDIIRFSTYRAEGLHVLLRRPDTSNVNIFDVIVATDNKIGSSYEMSAVLLPLLAVNPYHFSDYDLLNVVVDGKDYCLLGNPVCGGDKVVVNGITLLTSDN